MSYDRFSLALKSTLDTVTKSLATTLGVQWFDLDSEMMSANLLSTDQAALGFAICDLSPAPRDPRYRVEFDIMAKTSHDPVQYTSHSITSKILAAFEVGAQINIRDYASVTPPTADEGYLLVTSATVMPQQFDRTAGFRPVRVQAMAQRW